VIIHKKNNTYTYVIQSILHIKGNVKIFVVLYPVYYRLIIYIF